VQILLFPQLCSSTATATFVWIAAGRTSSSATRRTLRMVSMTVIFCYVVSWLLRVSRSCDVGPGEVSARREGRLSNSLGAPKNNILPTEKPYCMPTDLVVEDRNPKRYGKQGPYLSGTMAMSICLYILCPWAWVAYLTLLHTASTCSHIACVVTRELLV